MSFELILPFFRPIEPLLLDEDVSEIMGNPDSSWSCEREGRLCQEPTISFDAGKLRTGLEVIANQLGKRLDEDNPRLHAQLPDGSRIAAWIPPLVSPAPAIAIRKFTSRNYTVDDLIARGTLTQAIADLLAEQIRSGKTLLISGGTGTGKTMIMLQILRQIKHRGDSAIVYDPAREFVKRFYDPKNGDVILNPLDKRCPYWGPAEELRRRSEAKALAVSLFQPPQDKKGEFFIESPQKIFAFLMAYGPTPEELVKWMSDPQEIDRRLKGTEHAHLIDPRAHQQRAGVLGSLGLVADSLRLLPNKGAGNGEWSATEWAETRQGWIFITSLPAEREALRPLQSLWIDLLVLRLLNEPKDGQKRAWFVIDELASLQKLPQLHTAITENRKSNNPVILGFQGKAQLEYLYGHLAEVMLSQPATSIWLKTKEPTAGEWVSKFIGKVEIERLRETHFDGSRAGRNFALDRQIEPLVMESEISGLPDLHAYMKYENYVTRFSFPYFDMPVVAGDFDLRDTPDDKLPYDPKNIGAAKPQLRPHELKPDANLPTPPRKSARTATEIVPQETDADRNVNAQQSLNLRG